MKYILFIFSILLTQMCLADPWDYKLDDQVLKTTSNGDKIVGTVFTITQGSKTLTFTPTKPPFMISNPTHVKKGGQDFLLTTSSYGASSVMFTVFKPDFNSKNTKLKPVCQVVSFKEETRLRVRNGYLQLRTLPTQNPQPVLWKNCLKLLSTKSA